MKKTLFYTLAVTCLIWGMQSAAISATKNQKQKSQAPSGQKASATDQKKQQLSAYMKKYDLNKNGKIDPEEKAAMKKNWAARNREILKKYDKNGDGILDAQERAVVQFN